MITEGSFETRFWFGNRTNLNFWKKRNKLTGHFIGIYGSYIYNYDIQFKQKGMMGDGYGAGLTYGYSHRLGRSVNMEYSLGVGALNINHNEYKINDTYTKGEITKTKTGWIVAPTKAKISLMLLLGNKKTEK